MSAATTRKNVDETDGKKRKMKMKKSILTLQDIEDLGGEQDDLDLLNDIDDNNDEEIVEEESSAKVNLRTKEVSDFLKGLKLSKKKNKLKQSDHKQKLPNRENTVSVTEDEPNSTLVVKKKKNKYKTQDNVITGSKLGTGNYDALVQERFVGFFENHKPRTYLLIRPEGKWYEQKSADEVADIKPVSNEDAHRLEEFAAALLEEEVSNYKYFMSTSKKRSKYSYVHTALASGTVADRLAAMTVLIQESSAHNLSILDSLLNMVSTKAKREYLMAIDTLRDIFLSDLLLDGRKLRRFNQQPLSQLIELSSGNKDARDKRLILWYFEDQLKRRYKRFVAALDIISHDTVEASKKKAMICMYELLVSNPEQEQVLLSNLVNKLGDPHHKAAALGSHKLNQLVAFHPNMQTVIALEVEKLLFRPNVGPRAQYYGICFLNQIILSHNDDALSSRLITIYFGFFKACVKRGEVDSKMMSALLTGVNRAYPYAKMQEDKVNEQIDTMYKVVHTVSFNISIQALMLIYQVLDSKQSISDRYYSALYRKLFDPTLQNASRPAIVLNLLYKSLKKDDSSRRIQAFIKRILQVCLYQAPPLVCGLLYLTSEVAKQNQSGLITVSQKPSILNLVDDDDEHFVDVDEEKDCRELSGENELSVHSLTKEEAATARKELTSGNAIPINANLTESAKNQPENSSDKALGSWHHIHNLQHHQNSMSYNPLHRNPLFSGAERECMWELLPLSKHYHPTVTHFANSIRSHESVSYTGDPLQDFTLIRFLDRFVYRNPKKLDANAGGSMESKQAILGRRKLYAPHGIRRIPVTSEEFAKKPEDKIPADEKFLFRYFQHHGNRHRYRKGDDDSDADSVNSEEFEQILYKFEPGDLKDEYDLDFASEFSAQKKKKKGKKGDPDSESDLEADDEDLDFENDEDFNAAFKDIDDELAEMEGNDDSFDEAMGSSDEDDAFEHPRLATGKKRQKTDSKPVMRKKLKHMSKDDSTSELFAAAEEFSTLMDESTFGQDTSTTSAMANNDNAAVKQLKWEQKRHQWEQGKDWKTRKRNQKMKGRNATKLPITSSKKNSARRLTKQKKKR